jgi:hypothetical protein
MIHLKLNVQHITVSMDLAKRCRALRHTNQRGGARWRDNAPAHLILDEANESDSDGSTLTNIGSAVKMVDRSHGSSLNYIKVLDAKAVEAKTKCASFQPPERWQDGDGQTDSSEMAALLDTSAACQRMRLTLESMSNGPCEARSLRSCSAAWNVSLTP